MSRSSDGQGDENSAPESTHCEGLGSEPAFWPADKLPSDVTNIWTYGYKADVGEGVFRPDTGNSILYHHANDLEVELERLLDTDVSNPPVYPPF